MNFYSDNRLPGLSTGLGSAIQHLHYLPFGEEQIDQRLTNFNSRYTFSAKEKDIETGYSYFGARYYTSDLSIWLSVDPLSDKYPNMSPYCYTANNPIRLIDPDGRDVIDVDEMGKTTITTKEGNDILRSAKTGQTKELSGNGVFAAARSEVKDADGNVKSTTLKGMSKQDARATFNFMADNTDAEWGYMEKKDKSVTVGSAHSRDGETLISDLVNKATPGSVVKYDHSHDALSSDQPSTQATSADPKKYSDVGAWKDMMGRHPNISLGIRHKGSYLMWIKQGEPNTGYVNKFYNSK